MIIATAMDDQIENTQRFLQARDWRVDVLAGPLNKGIQAAAILNPDYLFVSLESMPANFENLYSALCKSFKTILYSEKQASRTLKAIQDLGTNDTLSTPITGPTIERLVLKIEKSNIIPAVRPLNPQKKKDAHLAHIDIKRISRATEIALGNVCQMNLAPRKALGAPSKLTCFALQTSRVDGYIVIASAGDMPLDFPNRLKRQIMEWMTMQQDFFRVGDLHEIEIQEVSFEGLAINVGEFFNKSIHLGNEVAISFFRIPEIDIQINDSAMENAVRTPLHEISPRAPLDFDIYVYMPLNKKFVLFQKAGGYLVNEQRTSLQFHGINEVHVKKEALTLLHRHKAHSHINEMILEYRSDITEVTVA